MGIEGVAYTPEMEEQMMKDYPWIIEEREKTYAELLGKKY